MTSVQNASDLRLKSYYVGFALTWPASSAFLFGIAKLIFKVPMASLVLPWILLCLLIVLGGAPLLYWSHKTALRTGSPRPVILAIELMFLCGLMPFGYFLLKQNGLDLWPAVGTCCVLLIPFILLYLRPPRKAHQQIEAMRRRHAGTDTGSI